MVTVKASHIVKPAESIPNKVMYVTDCDQVKPITHAPVIYFYRNTTHKSLGEAAQILKYSLSKALVIFYPLAGRLHWANGGRVELHCNSMGALLIEADSDLKIDDFGDFSPNQEIRSLIPSADFTTTPLEEVPLLLVQVTKFSCGGISLGTGLSHIVIDGQSALHFIAEWAKIARGEMSQDHPFLDRTIMQQYVHDHKSLALPNLKFSDFFPLPLLIGQTDNLEERKKETIAIMLKLSKEQILVLKDKVNKANQDLHSQELTETLKNKAKQHPFTRFEAVCAHIWKCLSMVRGLMPEQETVLYVTVDFRNRLKPPLPKVYFGNAIVAVPVTATVGDLLSKPLRFTSGKIRQAIENVTDEYVRSYLACIKNIPDVANNRHFHTVGCSKGSFFGNPNLIITTWVGLPLYGANFGWGDEVFVGPGALGYDGKIFLLPTQNGDGSFVIPLRLQVEYISAFKKVFYETLANTMRNRL